MDQPHTSTPGRRGRAIALAAAALATLCAIAGGIVWLGIYATDPPGVTGLARELRDRGRIAVLGADDLVRLETDGAQHLRAGDVEGLEQALRGSDEDRLDAVLAREGIAGILVDGRGASRSARGNSLGDRLRAYDHFEVLQGVHLTPVAALYVRRRGSRLSDDEGELLARAARQIVGGASLPRIRAFPEPLRRTRNAEVLVMLRQGGRPRLWRSARGGSIARALITAASVARERWADRELSLGGSIDQLLPSMIVEVYLLEEDGTIGERTAPFVERALTEAHGVAFEDRGSWHYLLPEATRERGEGSAVRAYQALFEDVGLPAESLTQRTIRLYRLVARLVGTSAPSLAGSGALPGSLDAPGLFDEARGIEGSR